LWAGLRAEYEDDCEQSALLDDAVAMVEEAERLVVLWRDDSSARSSLDVAEDGLRGND
jgi:hypothetical protein